MRAIIALSSLILLGGCAGSVVGDAMAGPEDLARRDDGYCQSLGLQFGTADYANCREMATNRREMGHARAWANARYGAYIATH